MFSTIFQRSLSFVSVCCVALAVSGASVIHAAEFKPFLTVHLAGPSTLISIAERVAAVVDMPEFTATIAQAAPFKNLPGVNAAGSIGLAIQTSEASPLGVDAIVSLPINNFALTGAEFMLGQVGITARRQGNTYTFATPAGNIMGYQKQGFFLLATEGAAEFAATADHRTLVAEVSEFTLGVHANLENIAQENIEAFLGYISMMLAMQGTEFDPEALSAALDQVAEATGEMSSLTWGITMDPRTLNVSGSTKVVAKNGTPLAESYAKSKEALGKTKMGAFLPETPQTIFSWHYLHYFTDRELEENRMALQLVADGLLEGLFESMEDADVDGEQLAKLIAAAEAFREMLEDSMDFIGRERLLDTAFSFDSEGTFIAAAATSQTAEAAVLDAKFYGRLLEILGDEGKTFIEGKTRRNYETVAGFSLSCIPNVFTDLPADVDLPEGVREVLENIPLSLFWAVKENEFLAYAVGLDFAKTEQALKTAMGRTATATPPKQMMVIAPKSAVEFFINKIVPLIPNILPSDSEQMNEVLTAFTTKVGANAKIVGTNEYTAASFTQKAQMPGELVIAVLDALLRPAVTAARGAAAQMQCSNHIKQIVLALHNYHDARGALPPLYTVDADGKPLHSWRVLILPYIEQMALYQRIRLDEPWDSPHNRQFHNIAIAVYSCPDNPLVVPGKACTYVAIAGEVFVPATAAGRATGLGFQHITDGMSNTIAIVEVKEPFNWMDPTADITLDELAKGVNTTGGRVGSHHPGGMNVGLFDGRVQFVPDTVDGTILRALGDPRDGRAVSLP